MGEVDSTFIQPAEHRPSSTIVEAEGIPVIDLSPIGSLDHLSDDNITENIAGIVSDIGKACEQWGFFQVINHGIPLEKLENIKLSARKFFSLPREEKMLVARDEENPMGYYDAEFTKNVRDWKQVFDFAINDYLISIPASSDELQTVKQVTNRWPEHPPEFREVAQEYTKDAEKLAFKLSELIALSLGLPANRFSDFLKDQSTSFIRLNHYPPCPSPHLALGLGPHTDSGVVTVLAQDDVEGLEVRQKCDGEWIRVKPVPGALIINVGDTVQVWSNDKYESVKHRVVVNSEMDRLSIPYLFNVDHHVNLKPLEELVNKKNVAKYKEFSWGTFLMTRKYSNLKKLDVENVQISHFKTN